MFRMGHRPLLSKPALSDAFSRPASIAYNEPTLRSSTDKTSSLENSLCLFVTCSSTDGPNLAIGNDGCLPHTQHRSCCCHQMPVLLLSTCSDQLSHLWYRLESFRDHSAVKRLHTQCCILNLVQLASVSYCHHNLPPKQSSSRD
jgi:hypothetical protein